MPGLLRVLFSVALLAVWPTVAPAAVPVPVQRPLNLFDLGAPDFTAYSTRDGLPNAVMAQVCVDEDGYVWATSAEQLARYDGGRWRSEGEFALHGVLGTFTQTHDGTLWVAFRDRGVAWRKDGAWHAVANLPLHHVRRVVETRDDDGRYTLWALSFGHGLWREEAGHWRPVRGNAGLPRDVISLAVTHALTGGQRLWLGSGQQGLWYRDAGGTWQRYVAPGFDATQVEYLLPTYQNGEEQLWISTYGAGVWRLDKAGLHAVTLDAGVTRSNEFYSLAASHLPNGDTVVWAASRGGLVRIHGDRVRVFDRRYGLPSNVVRDVVAWRSPGGEQVLWLATEAGMVRALIEGNPWQTASLLGASSNGVFAVQVEPDGHGGERLWVGSMDEGLGLYEQGKWRYFGVADGLPAPSIRAIRRAPDAHGVDTLWMGFQGGALARVLPGPRFETVPVPWPLVPAQSVTDLLGREFRGQHELWVATRLSGLYRWRDGQWTALRPAGGSTRHEVTALVNQVDSRGRQWIWATTEHGLVRYGGDKLSLFGTQDGLPDDGYLTGISLFTDGTRQVLWMGSERGVVQVDVSDPEHPRVLPDKLPPPPDPFIYSALRDSHGRVYVCSNNGVQQLTPTAHGYTARVFGRRDGLPHDECNTQAQFIDAHDRYWVGTLGGLGVYDPALDRPDHTRKPLRITEVTLDGLAISAHHIVLTPDAQHLVVNFALQSWRDEDRSRYRTQLIGDEGRPTDWTRDGVRVFDHLSPGHYVLRIEARDYAGNPSQPIELPLRVLPAWWQTRWAQIGYLLLAVLTFYLLLYWRVRHYRRQRAQLQALVAARTGELHAANARLTELSYRDPLTGLANRRRLHERLDELAQAGDPRPSSLVFVDVDHFKAYNDSFGHPAGDEALRAVAAAMQACVPADALVARYGGEEFACLLPATGLAAAREVAECIRAGVQVRAIPVPGTPLRNHATISAGVAERVIVLAADTDKLLREADAAMYEAKNAGRNCVRG